MYLTISIFCHFIHFHRKLYFVFDYIVSKLVSFKEFTCFFLQIALELQQTTNRLFGQKMVKNVHYNLLKSKLTSSSDQKFKTQRNSVYSDMKQRKTSNNLIWETWMRESLVFFLEKWLKWLTDYQKQSLIDFLLLIVLWTNHFSSRLHLSIFLSHQLQH